MNRSCPGVLLKLCVSGCQQRLHIRNSIPLPRSGKWPSVFLALDNYNSFHDIQNNLEKLFFSW